MKDLKAPELKKLGIKIKKSTSDKLDKFCKKRGLKKSRVIDIAILVLIDNETKAK